MENTIKDNFFFLFNFHYKTNKRLENSASFETWKFDYFQKVCITTTYVYAWRDTLSLSKICLNIQAYLYSLIEASNLPKLYNSCHLRVVLESTLSFSFLFWSRTRSAWNDEVQAEVGEIKTLNNKHFLVCSS